MGGKGMDGGVGWIWIWGLILRRTGPPGGSTMASLTTLQIGQPCHVRCAPQAFDGPGGGGGWAL